jgi:hypothetical protein
MAEPKLRTIKIARRHGSVSRRDWLSNVAPASLRLPGGRAIASRYKRFRIELITFCDQLDLRPDELTFNDYVILVEQWLRLDANAAI